MKTNDLDKELFKEITVFFRGIENDVFAAQPKESRSRVKAFMEAERRTRERYKMDAEHVIRWLNSMGEKKFSKYNVMEGEGSIMPYRHRDEKSEKDSVTEQEVVKALNWFSESIKKIEHMNTFQSGKLERMDETLRSVFNRIRRLEAKLELNDDSELAHQLANDKPPFSITEDKTVPF